MKDKIIIYVFIIYFFSRLFFLQSLPIFNDEAIYLHWGFLMTQNPNNAFFSLFDGKPPLFLWLLGYFQKLPLDPLITGRLVSILFGSITLLGLLKTAKLLKFSLQAQIILAIVYITNPVALFFDRLAILDSAISTIFIWVVYFSLKIYQSATNNQQSNNFYLYSILLGLVQGLGLWFKGTANFFLFLPFILPILSFIFVRDFKRTRLMFIQFLASFFLAQIIFLPLRLQPLFNLYQQREQDFLLNLKEAVSLTNIFSHFQVASLNFLIFVSLPVLIVFFAGLGNYYKKHKEITLFLFFSAFVPLIYEMIFARYFLFRYYLFTILPLLILSAYQLPLFKKQFVLTFSVLFLPAIISLFIILRPYQSLITLSFSSSQKNDMASYVLGWPSGWGVKETADWLNQESKRNPIIVLVRADSGNPEDAMFVYLRNNKNIFIGAINRPLTQSDLVKQEVPIYFVSRGEQYLGMKDFLEEKALFKKPGNSGEFVGIYRITDH